MSGEKEQEVDLAVAAKKIGFPSFDEFRKNPDYWRSRIKLAEDHLFQSVDKGSSLFRNIARHQYIYETFEGVKYDCGGSLEKVEGIMYDEGLTRADLEIRPEMREDTSHKMYIETTWKALKTNAKIQAP